MQQLVWQLTTAMVIKMMQWLTACPASAPYFGPLCDVWIGLYQPPTAPITANSVLAAITEADYDGYARQEVVWFPTFTQTSGPQIIIGVDQFYAPTDSLSANTITGVFLSTAVSGGVLLGAATLASPGVTLSTPETALVVEPEFSLPYTQTYGGPVVKS